MENTAEQIQALVGEIRSLREEITYMKKDTTTMANYLTLTYTVYESFRQPINSFLSSLHAITQWITYQEEIEFLGPIELID